MSRLKDKMAAVLYKIRNPEEDSPEFRHELGFKRLLFLAPFVISALIFFLLSLQS